MPDLSSPDPEALMCALVLAPNTYARNRFFELYNEPVVKRARRRARRIRGLLRQLLGQGREPAELVGEQVFDDRVLLRMAVPRLNYQRTTSLSPLEASLLHYALSRSRGDEISSADRERVELALSRLDAGIPAPPI